MTKTEAIKTHLIDKGSITSWEAIELYGATRLSAVIYNLRYKYNMTIVNENIDFTDRYGHKGKCVRYIYEVENEE